MKKFKGTPGHWVATQYGYEKWSVIAKALGEEHE